MESAHLAESAIAAARTHVHDASQSPSPCGVVRSTPFINAPPVPVTYQRMSCQKINCIRKAKQTITKIMQWPMVDLRVALFAAWHAFK